MLVLAAGFMFFIDSGLYNVLNYRLGHRLPLAPVVLLLYHADQTPELRPDPADHPAVPGRAAAARRGGAGWWADALTLAAADVIVQAQMVVYALTNHRTQVDASGQLLLSNGAYCGFRRARGLDLLRVLGARGSVTRW